jgi:hypothetical protein
LAKTNVYSHCQSYNITTTGKKNVVPKINKKEGKIIATLDLIEIRKLRKRTIKRNVLFRPKCKLIN